MSDLPSGGARIDYIDCEDKKTYSFEMTQQWPRPFVIYEVEVLDRGVLRDLLAKYEHERSSGQSGVGRQVR